jgi:hypothetical protein
LELGCKVSGLDLDGSLSSPPLALPLGLAKRFACNEANDSGLLRLKLGRSPQASHTATGLFGFKPSLLKGLRLGDFIETVHGLLSEAEMSLEDLVSEMVSRYVLGGNMVYDGNVYVMT